MTPNPPTDNLYKFVTFLGIALLVFSTWSLGDNLRKMQEARMTSVAETTSLDDEVNQLSGNVSSLSNSATEAYLNAQILEQEKAPDTEKIVRLLSKATELQDATIWAKSEMTQLQSRQKELRKITDKSNIVIKSLEIQNYFLYVGIGVGGFMSVLGFVFWYYFHQRYQDFALRTSLNFDPKNE